MQGRSTEIDGLSVLLLDVLDQLPAEHAEFVLVTGAFSGLDSARRVLRRPPRLAIFSDAGVGKDGAGIAGLELLEAFHIAASAVSIDSARIGDAADILEHGVISHRNQLAIDLGVNVGDGVREVLAKLAR